MKTLDRVSLRGLNSFGVEATAERMVIVEFENELPLISAFNRRTDIILGGGSNVLFETDVPGTVFLNRITGRKIIREHEERALVEVGAGENWHQLVLWSLEQGLSGLENLSLIPGLAGAAPVQNIGAYGVELASVLDKVFAWDLETSTPVVFDKADCQLAYRDSRFKSLEPGRYLITSIHLCLNRRFNPQLEYSGLASELRRRGITRPSPSQVSAAVIDIRRQKLPDPAVTGNAGSFFKNPVLERARADALLQRFPGLPAWPAAGGGMKLSAAWMIENCGLKGYRIGDAAVSTKHALVLINCGASSGRELAGLAHTIQTRIGDEYGIRLEQEPVSIRF